MKRMASDCMFLAELTEVIYNCRFDNKVCSRNDQFWVLFCVVGKSIGSDNILATDFYCIHSSLILKVMDLFIYKTLSNESN